MSNNIQKPDIFILTRWLVHIFVWLFLHHIFHLFIFLYHPLGRKTSMQFFLARLHKHFSGMLTASFQGNSCVQLATRRIATQTEGTLSTHWYDSRPPKKTCPVQVESQMNTGVQNRVPSVCWILILVHFLLL
jgi:hypothetical protein